MRNRKGNPQTERGTLNQKGESQSKPSGRDALKIHRLAVCFEFGGQDVNEVGCAQRALQRVLLGSVTADPPAQVREGPT